MEQNVQNIEEGYLYRAKDENFEMMKMRLLYLGSHYICVHFLDGVHKGKLGEVEKRNVTVNEDGTINFSFDNFRFFDFVVDPFAPRPTTTTRTYTPAPERRTQPAPRSYSYPSSYSYGSDDTEYSEAFMDDLERQVEERVANTPNTMRK